jgi:hypothetical protein
MGMSCSRTPLSSYSIWTLCSPCCLLRYACICLLFLTAASLYCPCLLHYASCLCLWFRARTLLLTMRCACLSSCAPPIAYHTVAA